METNAPLESVQSRPVWDGFVRLFHWTLVTCVVFNGWVMDDGEDWHRWSGYLASGLVLMRVLWGFVGSRHARFSDFWPSPQRVKAHLRALSSGQMPHHWGHNPLGALMMLWLMGLVLILGVSGWMQGWDAFWGEEWLQDLHEVASDLLLWSAGLHAAAALGMGYLERTRLVKAMFTGVKERW